MITKIKDNIFQLSFQEFGSYIYIVLTKNQKIIIDTSSEKNQQELLKDLQELKIKPEEINLVLLTHRHWDHAGNLKLFSKAKVYDEKNIKDFHVSGFEVIKTPGHTKDSICFLYADILFSGDTIFHNGGIGRTDLQESQPEKMQDSLNKLKKIKYRILCPGHVN